MKRLLLLRHAKSSWDHPGLDDFERPLNDRGRRDAPRVGRYLADHDRRPDHVLCSPARRTDETWRAVSEALGGDVPFEFEPSLYLAPPSTILRLVQSQPIDIETLLVIGHNPGTEEVALRLVGSGSSDALNRMRTKVPTAALIEIEFDVGRWGEVETGQGRLIRFVTPHDL